MYALTSYSTPSADAPNAAFYSKAASNDWTGNRAANTYNGMLLDAKKTQGSATGNVCPSKAALGRWVGNTIHGCSRFGLYTLGAPGNFPKRTDRSIHTNGFNQNFQLCEGYDTTEIINPGTTDRGYPGAFYENVDYHNVFVGELLRLALAFLLNHSPSYNPHFSLNKIFYFCRALRGGRSSTPWTLQCQ